MSTAQILVGCDPEIFVKKNGVFHSAHGLVKGDKQNPLSVPNGAVQVDGMALEFNINPANTEHQFVYNVNSVLDTLRAMVPEFELAPVPVAHFTPEHMAQQPAEALELGCEPDFCAYTNGANPRPDNLRPMRTASGHVHIGWVDHQDVNSLEADMAARAVSQQMDIILGVPSLFYDFDEERRSMYGKAGCYRRKVYGAEYRTLSNAWLLTDERKAWIFRNVQKGMQMLFQGRSLFDEVKGFDIPDIINNSKRKEAEKVIQLLGLETVA